MRPAIGVLSLQGDFAAHARSLDAAGAAAREVRRVSGLDGLAGLVIPGGESTTLLKLMEDEPWFEAIRGLHERGGLLFGTCAGAILLAREVTHPRQRSLGLLDATIERNAYGHQVDSFETHLEVPSIARNVRALFIRAPRFTTLGAGVEVLSRLSDEPVLVRQGKVIAATFHTELTADSALHELIVRQAMEANPAGVAGHHAA